MKEIDLKERVIFYNMLKRIYVAAKKEDINSKEVLAVPIVKSSDTNTWSQVGSRMISYRFQDLCPVELGSPFGVPGVDPFGWAA